MNRSLGNNKEAGTVSANQWLAQAETLGATQAGAAIGDWSRPFLGRFQITSELGSGGMGHVYRAIDLELDELIALKVLHSAIGSASGSLREQLRREVKAARRIQSPHAVRIYEIGVDGDVPWFAMELIEGGSLADRLASQVALELGDVIEIGRAIAQGLEAAHRAGVVHRDLKPSNVLLNQNRIAICDFGLAHLDWNVNQTRSAVGTLAYCAPEQMSGGLISPATDLFSLGVVLYEMATGRQPWSGDSLLALAMARSNSTYHDPRELVPDLPDALVDVIAKCLHIAPEGRPVSASWVAAQLGRLAGARPPSMLTQAREVNRTLGVRHVPRIAVLPLAGIGPVSEEAAGLAEDLTASLMAHRQIRVVASRVARSHFDAALEPAEIGRRLGVAYVVDGSLRRVGGLTRIHMTLTQVDSGVTAWTTTMDCDEARARCAHDEIAATIVRVLTGGAEQLRTVPLLHDPEAMRAYLLGKRAYQEAMGSYDPVLMRVALQHMETAHELAPDEPLVCAGLAIAVSGQLAVDAEIPTGALDRAQTLSRRAVELAPQAAESWLAQGLSQLHGGQAVAAAFSLRRALALAPSLAAAHTHLATLLMDIGRLELAESHLTTSLSLGGDVAEVLGETARLAAIQGDHARCKQLEHRFERDGLPRSCLWRGLYSGALAVNDRQLLSDVYWKISASPTRPPFVEALRLALGGVVGDIPVEDHEWVLAKAGLNAGATPQRRCRSLVLWVEAQHNEPQPEKLLEWLCAAVAHGLCNLVWFQHSPALARVRGLAGYLAIHEEITLRADGILDAYHGGKTAGNL